MVHLLVARLQHWPARQSPVDLQQATQAPPWQHLLAPQSVSAQHSADWQAPWQHMPLVPHWALVWQAQFEAPH